MCIRDRYQALGGDHRRRVRVFRIITVIFLTDLLRQTLRNLWHDGGLFHWQTWHSAGRLLLAKDGLIRGNVGLWRDYMRADFHPEDHDASLSQAWLRDNTVHFTTVGQAA